MRAVCPVAHWGVESRRWWRRTLARGEQVPPRVSVSRLLGKRASAAEERLEVLWVALEHPRAHGDGRRPVLLPKAHLRLVELAREPQRRRLRLAALRRLELVVDQLRRVVVPGQAQAQAQAQAQGRGQPTSGRPSSGRPPASARLGPLAARLRLAGRSRLRRLVLHMARRQSCASAKSPFWKAAVPLAL